MKFKQSKDRIDQPRQVVLELLCRIEAGDHANQALAEGLESSKLSPRDRKFIAAMVYGTLRWQARLDHDLDRVLDQPLDKLQPDIRNILRFGLYQIDFAYSVPPEVAVSTSVDLAEQVGQGRAKPLVNAVLRKLTQVRKLLLKKHESLRYGLPSELFGLLKKAYGYESALELAKVFLEERSELAIRPNCLLTSAPELGQILTNQGFAVRPGVYLETALRFTTEGQNLADIESFKQGLWVVQDEAAQLVAHLLKPESGERILDACAAPGGKTGAIYEKMAGHGFILAGELKPERVQSLRDLFSRMGYGLAHSKTDNSGIYAVERDASKPLSETEQASYDRVLLDVPCSAAGLLGKQPDLRTKLSYRRIQELLEIQQAILQAQQSGVKPGGYLVYSTCSILPDENELQIKRFLESEAGKAFERVDFRAELPASLRAIAPEAGRGELLLRPDMTPELDGFFIAKLRRING